MKGIGEKVLRTEKRGLGGGSKMAIRRRGGHERIDVERVTVDCLRRRENDKRRNGGPTALSVARSVERTSLNEREGKRCHNVTDQIDRRVEVQTWGLVGGALDLHPLRVLDANRFWFWRTLRIKTWSATSYTWQHLAR
jgi:hypothetical protein